MIQNWSGIKLNGVAYGLAVGVCLATFALVFGGCSIVDSEQVDPSMRF